MSDAAFKPGDCVLVDEYRYGEIVKKRREGWLVEMESGEREIHMEYEMEIVEEKTHG
jgi:hypothetical protein